MVYKEDLQKVLNRAVKVEKEITQYTNRIKNLAGEMRSIIRDLQKEVDSVNNELFTDIPYRTKNQDGEGLF